MAKSRDNDQNERKKSNDFNQNNHIEPPVIPLKPDFDSNLETILRKLAFNMRSLCQPARDQEAHHPANSTANSIIKTHACCCFFQAPLQMKTVPPSVAKSSKEFSANPHHCPGRALPKTPEELSQMKSSLTSQHSLNVNTQERCLWSLTC